MFGFRHAMQSVFFVCWLLIAPTTSREVAQPTLPGWGKVLDPMGDCRFIVRQTQLTIAIPGTDHALAIERGQINAPRVLQVVKGNFVVQVKVSGAFPKNSRSLVTSRLPFYGAGLLLWQNENNYVRLERTALFSQGNNLSYVNFEKRQNGKWANLTEMPLTVPDQAVFLKLERQDDQISAAASYDGKHWTSLPSFKLTLPTKLQVGILAGHNTASPFAPVFTNFSLQSRR
ncbi:MAG: DUF1349 domain-containing protein [Leptolyngbya sp. BL-A-14]